MQSQSKLVDKFQLFVSQYSNGEEIDKLTMSQDQQAKKKADYFFYNRELVCEQKNLEQDMGEKIQAKVDELMTRRDAPLVYGTADIQDIIKTFPDAEKINRDFFEIATSSIKNIFQKANRQIRTTKKNFNLNDSKGILFVVNETAYYIEPHDIIHRVSRLFSQKEKNNFRYDNIHALWLIQPSHILMHKGVKMIPSVYLINNFLLSEMKDIEDLTNKIACLDIDFSKHIGQPYISGDKSIRSIKFKPSKEREPLKINDNHENTSIGRTES